MSNLISNDDIANQIAADSADRFVKASAKIEAGKLFAVRVAYSNKRGQAFVKRLGAQWEAVSKLWVIKADARNMDAYGRLFADGQGYTVLSGTEYAAAYAAARA